ncbi:MAG: V-type ATP synthase subunit I [Oscillospiraceae bacterium]|nr:V-type ATP synthase subunit I [Oscillospiraceae bacterium]
MAVCKMQRMNIFGLQENRKDILERLQSWGILEVNIPVQDESLNAVDTLSSRQLYERQAQTLQQALELLDRYAPEKKSMLAGLAGKDLIDKTEYAGITGQRGKTLEAAQDLLTTDKEISETRTAIARLEGQIEGLQPWMALDVPMNCAGTQQTRLFLGTIPGQWTVDSLLAALAEADPEAETPDITLLSQDKDYVYMAALCLKENAAALEDALRSIGFAKPAQASGMTPAAAQESDLVQIRSLNRKIDQLSAKLQQAGTYRWTFQILSDYYRVRADKYEVLGQLPQSSKTFLVSGYVPQEKAKALQNDLEDRCGAAVEIEELPEEEDAPVLLKNNAFGSLAEGILKSFGLPGKGEIDPSFLTACFYVFFFGLMLSDAAYGAIVSLACGFCLLKFPRMGENMKKSLQLFFWCGISTLFWGIMFGGYFGDLVSVVSRVFFGHEISVRALWFIPLNDPAKLLVYSMLFGLVHLFTGLGIKGYMALRDKNYASFVFDVLSWFLLLVGLLLMLLPTDLFYGISQMAFHFPAWLTQTSKILAIVGAAMILLFSARGQKNIGLRIALGAYDLYNITGWLSDVLSYSRLLALGLATGVIAQVVNQMGSMLGGGVLGAIVFIVVFVAGHLMNLAINMLGAYVHTCRLQYVEFYGKFYEGGGREFHPFQFHTNYIDIKEEP